MAVGSERLHPEWELVKQGAEGKIYRTTFFGKPTIVKERFVKSYRVPALDKKLTQKRMSQEVRSIARCRRGGVRAPAVYHVDFNKRLIFMECIVDGMTLRDYIRQLDMDKDSSALYEAVSIVGSIIAEMHNFDLIHGDLTTSNMIYDPAQKELTLIDFGLSSVSTLTEDKGVDLYVLERAFLSTHPNTELLFKALLESYSEKMDNSRAVIAKLDEVRMRGRKRTMVG